MLNYKLMNEIQINLYKILKEATFCEEEKRYRKEKLYKFFTHSIRNENIDQQYIATLHELRSYSLLEKMGNVKIALDYKQEPGPDISYKDNRIECTICTEGNDLKEIQRFRDSYRTQEYSPKEMIILTRLTRSYKNKKRKN